MVAYPAGPYILEFPLVVTDIAHAITVNCDVIGNDVTGTPPASITLRAKGGVPVALNTAADALWTVIKALYNTGMLCSTYNLWKMNVDNNDRLFVSGGTLTSPNGGAAAVTVLGGQATYTMRSGNGGIVKLTLIEGTANLNTRIPFASDVLNGVPALRTYLLGSTSIVMGRDRSFPVAAMSSSYGQNEKIFKRRFRS